MKRETRETRVRVDVDLDRESPIKVSTGIGFFDHMREQIAKHGVFALRLQVAQCHNALLSEEEACLGRVLAL